MARSPSGACLELDAWRRVAGGGDFVAARPPGAPEHDIGEVPVSYPEERMFWLWKVSPEKTHARTVWSAVRLRGRLDAGALDRAASRVLLRHDVLRSRYRTEGREVRKVIAPPGDVGLERIDLRKALSGCSEEERSQAAIRWIAERAQRRFDITAETSYRLESLDLGDDDHLLFVAADHIVFDGGSSPIFWAELSARYGADGAPRPVQTPEPAVQYADFARWQKERYRDALLEAGSAYWRRRLSGAEPMTRRIPNDQPWGPVEERRRENRVAPMPCGLVRWHAPGPLVQGVRRLAARARATPFVVYYAAFASVLGRHAATDDVTVGCVTDTRNRVAGLHAVVGTFNNSVPLRLDLSGDPTVLEVIGRASAEVREVQSVPEFPIVPFVFPGMNDLLRTLFNFMAMERRQVAWPSLQAVPVLPAAVEAALPEPPTTYLDLYCFVVARANDATATLRYNQLLWSEERMRRLLSDFGAWIERAATDPTVRHSAL